MVYDLHCFFDNVREYMEVVQCSFLCMKPRMHVVITISGLTFPFLGFDCIDKRIIFVFFC
jgi:hypothetical protein